MSKVTMPEPVAWHPIDGDTRGYEGDVVLHHKTGDYRLAHSNWLGNHTVQPYPPSKPKEPAYFGTLDMGFDYWLPLEGPVAAQAHSEIEITDGMALTFHNAITDGSIGQQDVDEIKIGLRAAFINVVDSLSRHDQAQQPVSGADQFRDAAQMIAPQPATTVVKESLTVDERELFEKARAAAASGPHPSSFNPWQAWQARAALAKTPVSGADGPEFIQVAHELKINPEPFQALKSGMKTAEIRDCSDRVFVVGQVVRLQEYEDGGYTDAQLYRMITHIQRGYGLPENLCILSYGPSPTTALAQQDADKVDAERYRWLFDARSDQECTDPCIKTTMPQDHVITKLAITYMSKSMVDAAIDTARKEQE